MVDILVFDDVEDLTLNILNEDGRTGVSWATRVPNPRPAEFGRLMRTGGPQETLVSEAAQLILESWAAAETRAVQILNIARGILGVQEGALFGYEENSGPANLPDPTTEQIRYTMLVTIRVRGSSLA